jgi:aldehyde:ferredoxin oxidoreductase
MQYYGYMGKILHVDLTSGDIREEDLDLDLARNYIGDLGIGARLIYNLIKPGIDPLSSENPIVIGAGPLCGTSYPGAAKCNVWTKLPLTNTVGHGVGSLSFAAGLKYAGYDELVITGRADKPVYLKVLDDDVEICDATGIWGKDIMRLPTRCGESMGLPMV